MQRNRVSKKKILSIAACAIIGLHSHAQDTSENRRALYGKWKVCIDTQFSKSYSCDNPYTSYTILPDGQYEEEREVLSGGVRRSEEHTSELQSQSNLVCRLLLEK